MRHLRCLAFATGLLLACTAAIARDAPPPFGGVASIADERLDPEFWIARAPEPDRVLLDRTAIDARNARLLAEDPSMHDLDALPATLTRAQVKGWIEALASPPDRTLHDVSGKPVAAETIAAILDARALDTIPRTQPLRHGLVVRRADLRAFPTALRVFRDADDHDIDRFQESALFPGERVVIVHASRDGAWRFVLSRRYAAWIAADAVAEGPAGLVLGYAHARTWRVVTGAQVRTVFTPEQPALSSLVLDMGLRLPRATPPADGMVNGQHAYAGWPVVLPLRDANGCLALAPALLPRAADTAPDYLPPTRANLIRQGFKFLGERYGWGHAYDGRDCSGFVSEIYRSMGLDLPRNTRDQSVSPALDPRAFGAADTPAARRAFVRALDVGDLVYIPGHVMMVIGSLDGEPWVIHDTTGITYRGADGRLSREKLNGVSVTPLLPLVFDGKNTYVERMTSVVHLVPDHATRANASP